MSNKLLRGQRCMFKGQKIVGDGKQTREELYKPLMAGKVPEVPRNELRQGEKAMYKDVKIVGDGEHTNEELYLKVMAGKVKQKRGAPKVIEPETIEKVVTKKKKSKK